MKTMTVKTVTCGLILAVFLSGCESMGNMGQAVGNMSRTQKGTAIGAGTGAAVGALVGKKKGKTGKGALIGGAVGALAGGLAGRYMDNQAKELEAVADTERTEEGVVVTLRDKVLFGFDSAALQPESRMGLAKIAGVLAKYPKTEITVAGHTDNVGKADYNQKLSERRANAVKFALADEGISPTRVSAVGFGADQPVASNTGEQGRSENRRVELRIVPNDALMAEAQAETGE